MALKWFWEWLQVFSGNPDSANLLAIISFLNSACVDSNDANGVLVCECAQKCISGTCKTL